MSNDPRDLNVQFKIKSIINFIELIGDINLNFFSIFVVSTLRRLSI